MLQLHYYHERFVILTEVDQDKDNQEQSGPAFNEQERLKRERRPEITEGNHLFFSENIPFSYFSKIYRIFKKKMVILLKFVYNFGSVVKCPFATERTKIKMTISPPTHKCVGCV